ncbi:putative methyltransferase [Sulfitobacter noctilucicola]|uniref:SAM-dependent methyltransferase n=1 Tax=Sulfitobacter noctilucicola TaxID=1342301 RepID=A0A7W6M654_9RHOB|nr:class I SAM-dependent methyltransferase [Sulfitobacter noctilucicola]KIN62317.1 putative methyltransferase [Sulfitobacter noctilucicola]MBB4173149.1 SAM-dependent methyltransferase [Sulfitobacter noctilucicola]
MSEPETIAVYDAQADDYDRMMRKEAEEQPIYQEFVASLPKGAHVLDLGCGPGNYARLFAEAGLKVTAIDASAEMVQRADKIEGVNARQGFFDDINDVDAYDGIWASFSLLHAPRADLPRHLAALQKALKSGGQFFIGMKTGTDGGRDNLGRFYEYYTIEELEGLLRTAGFTPDRNWTGYGKGLAGQY